MAAFDLFNCFVRKTEDFRTKLGAEIDVEQFCLPEADMIHYTERWIDDITERRQIGYSDGKYIDEEVEDGDDIRATETEILEQMLEFLETEDDPMVEMFGSIHTRRLPTLIVDEYYGRILDFPYSGGITTYQKWMIDQITGGKVATHLHFPEEAFVLTLINKKVEKWMTNFVKEYLTDKLKNAFLDLLIYHLTDKLITLREIPSVKNATATASPTE